jgi:hypothetical protein
MSTGKFGDTSAQESDRGKIKWWLSAQDRPPGLDRRRELAHLHAAGSRCLLKAHLHVAGPGGLLNSTKSTEVAIFTYEKIDASALPDLGLKGSPPQKS